MIDVNEAIVVDPPKHPSNSTIPELHVEDSPMVWLVCAGLDHINLVAAVVMVSAPSKAANQNSRDENRT